jgi:hypothetical protein
VKHTLLLLICAACAERIGPPPNDNPDAAFVTGDDAGDAAIDPNADGSSTTIIDATSYDAWIDVDALGLRFQRFHISTLDGTEVAPVESAFDAVTAAPATGWLHDEDVDGDGAIDYAFDQGDGWYAYDEQTHVLTPLPLVWVIRSPATTLKLRIDSYYDAAGTSGWFTVTWKHL